MGAQLSRDGWNPGVFDQLTSAINVTRYSGKVTVFYFDNTTQARDVGEATIGQTDVDGAAPHGHVRLVVGFGGGPHLVQAT